MRSPPRLVYVVTHPVSADALLRGQLAFMRDRGFDVSVVASPGPELDRVREREGVRTIGVPMERAIRPQADARSLGVLTRTLRELRPDIVNASTPKAGLLGMLAARALRVPFRIYLLRGLRLETTRGALRTLLSATERITARCAQTVVCNSASLRTAAVDGGHIPAEKATTLGGGSSNGVQVDRFLRTAERLAEGQRVARAHGIADDERVIGFVGRFDPDKGIGELLAAFDIVRALRPKTRLVLVGGGYAGDLDLAIVRRVEATEGVVSFGRSDDLAPLYARMDVLAFPSLREGFPNVPLEAACAEVPAVGYASTGVVDAIAHGVTGTIVKAHDVDALARALSRYLDDEELRRRHGIAARERAARDFDRTVVWKQWEAFYRAGLVTR